MIHLFCDCESVSPIWQSLIDTIHLKHNPNFRLTRFQKVFGVITDKLLSYLFLCLKYIYLCKFKDKKPAFNAFKCFLKVQRESEYYLAKKRGKLPAHFGKWKFDL